MPPPSRLTNALEMARTQFVVAKERSSIVHTLCEAARSSDDNVRKVEFEGLEKVAEIFYRKHLEYARDI